MQYKIKAIQAGSHVDVFRYSKDVFTGFKRSARRIVTDIKVQQVLSDEDKKRKAAISLASSLRRSRTAIRLMVNTNYDCNKFLTLTHNKEILTLKESNPLFMKFIQRLKYRFSKIKLKYIAVPEFQPKSKRVHYHLLINLPFVNPKEIEKIWGHGFVKIKKIYEIKNMGLYMSKYLTKDCVDERYASKNKYFCSTNCKRPIVMRGLYAEGLYENIKNTARLEYEKEFKENEYVGKTIYQVFDIGELNKK